MEINFKSNKIERTFSSPKEIMKAYGTRARKVNQRLSELKAAPNLKEMKNFPQANCHRLSTGNFAVDISANFRIVFEVDESLPFSDKNELMWELVTKIKIVSVEDYH